MELADILTIAGILVAIMGVLISYKTYKRQNNSNKTVQINNGGDNINGDKVMGDKVINNNR